MGDLWNGAVGETPKGDAIAAAAKVNHDVTNRNIEAFLSRVEAFLQVNEDETVGSFLNASKQVILDRCSPVLRMAHRLSTK